MSGFRWSHVEARSGWIVAGVAVLVLVAAAVVGDPAITRHDALTVDAPVHAAPSPVGESVAATSPSSSSVAVPGPGGPSTDVPDSPAAPIEHAELVADEPPVVRLEQTSGATVPVWQPAPGDCAAWAEVFRSYGATETEVAFFVPRILDRESGCGRDTLNDATGDTSVCQVNPVHNRAGYFGGRHFGAGGWLLELHGLTTRVDTDNPAWAAACLTLLRVCGTGPWQPPYSCANRRLP